MSVKQNASISSTTVQRTLVTGGEREREREGERQTGNRLVVSNTTSNGGVRYSYFHHNNESFQGTDGWPATHPYPTYSRIGERFHTESNASVRHR